MRLLLERASKALSELCEQVRIVAAERASETPLASGSGGPEGDDL